MASDDLDRVVPMDELDDFRVSRDDPDPRGWEVVAADGRKIGEVDELLVDPRAMQVRYLDVDLDDGLDAPGEDRHVLVPIGYARLDGEHDRVIVDELSSADLRAVPRYDHGPLTRDVESSVRDHWRRGRGERHREMDDGPRRDRSVSAHDGERSGILTSGGMRAGGGDDDFYADDLFDESQFWAARRSTGLGGALGEIGADPGYPRDLRDGD
jgi:sporulation protein YlmC with PRC-barrel domain